MTTIVVTGDSNTTNNYASTTYADLLQTALGATVINTAVSGYYAEGILSFINSMILNHSPDICIIMIGTNDIAHASENAHDNREMITDYLSTMQSIITTLQINNIKVILMSPPMSRNIEDCKRGEELSEALKWLCIKNNVEFIDIYSKFLYLSKSVTTATLNSYFLADPDKYHLNNSGHALIANYILENNILKPIIAPTATETIFTQTLNTGFGNISSQTVRTTLNAAAITNMPSGAVTKIRLTFKGSPTEPIILNGVYIGQVSSGCATNSFSQVKVTGAAAFTVSTNAALVTDWIDFNWDKSSPLMLSMYCSGNTSNDMLYSCFSNPNGSSYLKSGNEAATLNPSGFMLYSGYSSLICQIETDGF